MKATDTLSEEQLGCLEAVQKINNEMHDKEGWQNHYTLLSFSACSYHWAITLNVNTANTEIDLYNSEQDDRIYYEKSDKYEEWYSFIKRKFRLVKKQLNEIKL